MLLSDLLRLVVTLEDGVDIDRADRHSGGLRSGTTRLDVPDAITTEPTLLASQLATPGQIGSAGRLIGMLSIAEGFDEPLCLRNRHSVTLAAILGLSYLPGLRVRALDCYPGVSPLGAELVPKRDLNLVPELLDVRSQDIHIKLVELSLHCGVICGCLVQSI